MGRFKNFINRDEDSEDYRKHDGKRDKKVSWKDEARKKRKARETRDDDHDEH